MNSLIALSKFTQCDERIISFQGYEVNPQNYLVRKLYREHNLATIFAAIKNRMRLRRRDAARRGRKRPFAPREGTPPTNTPTGKHLDVYKFALRNKSEKKKGAVD